MKLKDVDPRTRELFAQHQDDVWRRTDRLFAYLLSVQWVAGIVVALLCSPKSWAGRSSSIHVHVWAAIFVGGAISALPVTLALTRPGRSSTRYVIAVAQMLTSALLIHLTGGRIETHFHIFGSLAFLAFYRDWRVLLIATMTVAADHLMRGMFWPISVYGVAYASIWRVLEHALWVVFEDVVLLFWCRSGLAESAAISQRQSELEKALLQVAVKDRLEKEMEIASHIQTGILPRQLKVDGLQIAAKMIPASEVGGDYYEVLPVSGGAWIGIGDVSGHGLTSGLIMLMIQSAVSGLGRHAPNATPRELLRVLNEMLYENIRVRLVDDNHATLSLMRYHEDGRIVFAGAHEDIVVCRADGKCELLETRGPWVGAVRSIGAVTIDNTAFLREGDVMLLYTDGVTEAVNRDGQEFGMERLCSELESVRLLPVDEIRDHLMNAVLSWTAAQSDDITLLVVRHCGVAAALKAA